MSTETLDQQIKAAEAAIRLIHEVDTHASERRIQDLEAHFDAADRQVAQLAQLKALNSNDNLTALLATVVANGVEPGGEADPT